MRRDMISIDTATNLHRYRQRYCRRIAMGKTQQEGENHNQCDGISTLIAPSAGFVSNIGRCRSSCEENSLRVEPSSIGGVSDDVKHTFSLLHSGFWRYQISPRQFYVFLSSILSILWKKWTGRSSRSRPLERCYCSCCHRRNLLKLPCTIACIVSAYSFYAMIFGTPSMSVLAAEKQDTSPLSNDGTVSPLDKHVIGDNKRSEQSSSNFFSFIDQNGDGILGTIELANFVQNYIGGTDFDTPEEVNSEVQSIIQNLDINKDVTLDKNDVYSYWMKLESLLTAEQVAEWVIYAVQLPEYVGRIFRDNVVTGYDFPELVEDNGKAIESDLGIHKQSFRKKLLRHIRARMIGIGDVPDSPSNVRHQIDDSCSSVKLWWGKSHARGFPVHSYRVQRRALDISGPLSVVRRLSGDGSKSRSDEERTQKHFTDDIGISSMKDDESSFPSGPIMDVSPLNDSDSPSSIELRSGDHWETVYCSSDTEYLDTGLESGHTYVYRIQAWNPVGKSQWVNIDISSSLKRKGCSVVSESATLVQRASSAFRHSVRVVDIFLYGLLRGIFTLVAIAAVVMRWHRAAATTLLNVASKFPWLWAFVNRVSHYCIGLDVVPDSMLGDSSTLRAQVISADDKSVKATGHDGHSRAQVVADSTASAPFNRRTAFAKKSMSTGSLMLFDGGNSGGGNAVPKSVQFQQSKSLTTLLGPRRNTNLTKMTVSDSDFSSVSVVANKRGILQNSWTECGDEINGDDDDRGGVEGSVDDKNFDDINRCNTCRKKFRVGKRWKHHCSRCLSTFCHKHGKVTHNNLTSCKMPGSCVCLPCLKSEELVRRLREEDGKRQLANNLTT